MLYALNDLSPQTQGRFFVAPDAAVIGDVYLAEDSSVWFGVVIRGDVERITIGRGSNIQDNSVLHCDPGAALTLDEFVTVGHQVTLHGCNIGDGSLIGIGSTILNNARIGRIILGNGEFLYRVYQGENVQEPKKVFFEIQSARKFVDVRDHKKRRRRTQKVG